MDISEETGPRGYRSLSLAFLVKILSPYFQVERSVDFLREILENCVPQEESGDSPVDATDDATLRKILSGERTLPKQYASEILRNFDQNGLELYLKEKLDAVSEQSLPALCKSLVKYVSQSVTDENIAQVLAERIRKLIEQAATAKRRNARKETPFPDETGFWESEEHSYKKTVNGHKVERIEKSDGKGYVSHTLLIDGEKVLEESNNDGITDIPVGYIGENGCTLCYEPDSLENTGQPVFTKVPLGIVSPDDPVFKQCLKEQERINRELERLGMNTTGEWDANISGESDTNTSGESDTNTSDE